MTITPLKGIQRPPFAEQPFDGQESVWDYPRPPKLLADGRLVEISSGEHLIARSDELKTLDILPHWASEALLDHEADPQQKSFDWAFPPGPDFGKSGSVHLSVMQSGLI